MPADSVAATDIEPLCQVRKGGAGAECAIAIRMVTTSHVVLGKYENRASRVERTRLLGSSHGGQVNCRLYG